MSFGHQSDVHKHLFAKRPLSSRRMVEDDSHSKIEELVQHEGLRLIEPPTNGEVPMRTHSNN
jgi:hypothetical protein